MTFSAVNKPELQFNSVLYTGNGGSNQAITGVGFQPDKIIIWDRDGTTWRHCFDSTRGVNKAINYNDYAVEGTVTTMPTFGADGFTVNSGNLNTNNSKFVAYCWKANAGTTASNTSGSITSTVQANTTAGFSIVKYTGTGSNATIGHGLSVAPKFIIVKCLTENHDWQAYHASMGNGKYIRPNTPNDAGTTSNRWQDTTPSTTVFSIGSNASVNASADTHIAYCWHDVQGFQKFGAYKGNGSGSSPPYINCGFRPAMIMVKNHDDCNVGNEYFMVADSATTDYVGDTSQSVRRLGDPVADISDQVDFLSNGFRYMSNDSRSNENADNYIYAAWAAAPIVASNNVISLGVTGQE